MNQNIADQVLAIVATHVDVDRDTLTLASTLKDLGIDSLDAIETIFDIEEHFNINFPDRDPNLDNGSIAGLVDAVEQALGDKATATVASAH